MDSAEIGEIREEDTVWQLLEAMEIGDLEPVHSTQGMEEADSCNIFYFSNVFQGFTNTRKLLQDLYLCELLEIFVSSLL